MIDVPVTHDAMPHGGESQEKKDESGWKVAPVDERDLNHMKMLEERGEWDPVKVARALEKFRPEPGEKAVIIGRRQHGGSTEHLGLFAAIQDVIEQDWLLNEMDDYNPEVAIVVPEYPTQDRLKEFLHRNSRAGRGYLNDWSDNGQVPYVELNGDANMGVVTIGVMDVREGTRTEMACTLHTAYH